MTRSRTGKVQGPALALLAVALVAVAVFFLLSGPGAPPAPVLEPEPDAVADLPAAGQLGDLPEVERQAPPPQPTRSETLPPPLAGATGAGVIGRVVDERGAPIAGASVWISERWLFGAAPVMQPVTEDPRHLRVTGADGSFLFEGLQAGAEMNLWAFHADYAPRLGAPFSAREAVQELPPLVLERGLAIEGVTQDTGGNPVSARVELILQDSGSLREGTLAEQREQDLRLGRLKAAQSDPTGRFSFGHVGSGTIWAVRASAEGYATAEMMPIGVQANRAPEPLVLVLGSEHVITGVVLNDERAPVGGAQVTVSRTQPRPVFTEQGVSEPDGSFTLRGLPEGVYGLAAVAEGYAYGSVKRVEVDGPAVEVMLSRKGGVAGRVTGPGGAGLTAFTLELMRTRRNTEQFGKTGLTWDVQSADGSYRIESLDAGSYVLLVRAPGACPTYSPGFQVGRDVVLGMDVQMRAGGRVLGRVVGGDGRPLAGARLSLHGREFRPASGNGLFVLAEDDPENVPESSAVSGADGRFVIDNAYTGELSLYVEHATHLPETVRVSIAEGASCEVGEVRMRVGGSITGSAVDQDGRPLAGGTVNVTREDGGELFHASQLLDSRGAFRFDGLQAGTYEIFAFPNVGDTLWFPSEDAVQRVYVSEGKTVEVQLRAPAP